MAHIAFSGNLGKDPELRYTNDGRLWVSLSVAWSERHKTNGNWEDGPTEWVNVTVNGPMAENVASSLHKGMTVDVAGRISPREWNGQQGPQRYLHVMADTVSPSLRFQQAQVQRIQSSNPPQGPGNQYQPQGAGDVWGSQQGNQSWGGDVTAVQDEQPPF